MKKFLAAFEIEDWLPGNNSSAVYEMDLASAFAFFSALFTLFAAAFPYFAISSSQFRLIPARYNVFAALSTGVVSIRFRVVPFVVDGPHTACGFQKRSPRHHFRVLRCALGDFAKAF